MLYLFLILVSAMYPQTESMVNFNLEINSRANKDGLFTLFIRVTQNRKSRKIKLSFRIPEDHFNRQAKYGKWIRMSNPKYAAHNKEIAEKIDELKAKYDEIAKVKDSPLDFIKKELVNPLDVTFKSYSDEYLKNLKSEAAISYYKSVNAGIREFLAHIGESTLISMVTTSHVASFKTKLLDRKLSGRTVNDIMSRVRTVFILATNDDTIVKDPFRANAKANYRTGNRRKLSDKKIKEMEELDLVTDYENDLAHHARNYYLFSYYNAGIRVADIIQLKHINITEDLRLEYEMDKTGHKKSIKLNEKSLQILNQYLKPNADPRSYIFPMLDDDKEYSKAVTYEEKRKLGRDIRNSLFNAVKRETRIINADLKTMSAKLKLDPHITFHTSRHSYADKARRTMKVSKKVTLVDIMNSLGHKKLTTTQMYMDTLDIDSLDEAMGDIFN